MTTGPARSLDVEAVAAVDTLGAGDFFHGALAYAISHSGLPADNFAQTLRFAAEVAGLSVGHFGSRTWLAHLAGGTPLPSVPT